MVILLVTDQKTSVPIENRKKNIYKTSRNCNTKGIVNIIAHGAMVIELPLFWKMIQGSNAGT